jgi:phosphate transport system substrate-binding protein
MPTGVIENKNGNFIEPSLESTTLAADIDLPNDTRASLTDTDAEKGYPIGGLTWILVYRDQKYDSKQKSTAETLVKLLWWMVHRGQEYAEPLDYAPLPAPAVTKAEKIIGSIMYNGEPIWKKQAD